MDQVIPSHAVFQIKEIAKFQAQHQQILITILLL